MHQVKRSCFVLRWKPPSLHIGNIDHLYIVDNNIITAGAAKYKLFRMKWLQLDTDEVASTAVDSFKAKLKTFASNLSKRRLLLFWSKLRMPLA